MAYLDNNGVLYLWGKIKAHVSGVLPSSHADLAPLYGTCATSNTDCYQYVFKIEGYYD